MNNYYDFPYKNFADPKKNSNFAHAKRQRPDGGIGRRAGLKHQWSNPSRFDPGSGYKELLILNEYQQLFFVGCKRGINLVQHPYLVVILEC